MADTESSAHTPEDSATTAKAAESDERAAADRAEGLQHPAAAAEAAQAPPQPHFSAVFQLPHSRRDQLGRVIGPGGKLIRDLCGRLGVRVDGLPKRDAPTRPTYTVRTRQPAPAHGWEERE